MASPAGVAASVAGSAYSWASDSVLIGVGYDRTGNDANSTITMASSSSTTAYYHVVTQYHETWEFRLSSGSDPMSAKTYSTSDGFGSAVAIVQAGPFCTFKGSFTVLDISHDGAGAVISLAVHLNGQCDVYPGAVVADLRFNSSVPFPAIGSAGNGTFDPVPATAIGKHPVTFTSLGTGPLTVSAVSIEGPDAASFGIDAETCTTAPVAVGATCSVTVAWTALTFNGTATLVVHSDSARANQKVSLYATWSSPLTAVPNLDLGTVLLTAEAGPTPLVITNAGTVPANVGTAYIAGLYDSDHPADFGIATDGCSGTTLPAAATCTIEVVATPANPYEEQATLGLQVGTLPPLNVRLHVTGAYRTASWLRSAIHYAAPTYTFNGGGALGRTRTSTGGVYLHAISEATRVGTTIVRDTGPYRPILYTRGNSAGTIWTAARRLNSTTQHGVWPGLASSSSYVYAEWVKVSKVVSFSTTAPRFILFRANSNHGSSTAWGLARRLTSATGRVDYPTIAAYGLNVYIAYTDANTGAVRVLVSHNHGSTWSNVALGTTTAMSGAGGRTGLPSVAASGATVIVSWIANNAGLVGARISTDSGLHWGATTILTTTSLSYPSSAVTAGRAGVAWIGANPSVRIWTPGGGWGPEHTVEWIDHVWLTEIYGPALVLIGSSTVGVGFSGCVQSCANFTTNTVLESDYVESPTNGADWYNGYSFPIGVPSDGRHASDGVSLIASSSTRREFLYTSWSPGTITRRLVHRSLVITPGPLPAIASGTTRIASGGTRAAPARPEVLRSRELHGL